MSKNKNKLSNITAADIADLQKALSVGGLDEYSSRLINTMNRLGLTKQNFPYAEGVLQVEYIDDIIFDSMKDIFKRFKK